MRKLIFLLSLAASLPGQTQKLEQHSYEVLATSGSRAVVIKEFFSQPFKSMPKGACTAEFTKPGIQRREHGDGKVQEYSLMWVQIIAEVGERVDWTCKGNR